LACWAPQAKESNAVHNDVEGRIREGLV